MDTPVTTGEPTFRAGMRRALDLVGTQAELERRTGIPQQTISWLLNRAEKISAEHAVAIDRATEGQVSKDQLRPDLFDTPPTHANGLETA